MKKTEKNHETGDVADFNQSEGPWLYSDIVKDHFFNPRNVLLDETDYQYDAKGIAGSPLCGDMMSVWLKVDPKTQKIADCKWRTFGSLLPGAKILMNDFSAKSVEEIKRGDAIIDGDGKKNFVEEILVKDYEGKIITIQLSTSKFYQFSLTPNHPIPCVKRKKIALVQRFSGNRWSEVSQKNIEESGTDIIPAGQLEKGDFMIFQVPTEIKNYSVLDEEICTLLGYYVSDGSSPSKNRVIFYFGLNEREYVNEIAKIAEKRKWDCRIHKRNTENVVCVQINNSKVVEILRKHGGLASHKNFSQEALMLNPKKQEKIINAYLNGDGWVVRQNPNWKPNYFISSSRENIIYQLQLMLGRLGIFAPIHKRESREFSIKGRKYVNSGEFNLVFRKNQKYSRIKHHNKKSLFLIPISKIETDDYKGKIYDISLLRAPKIYKIKGISVHNCASAIAATSMMSVMVTEQGGMPLKKALNLKTQQILERLGGLPDRKYHCSVLGLEALKNAVNDYFQKQKS